MSVDKLAAELEAILVRRIQADQLVLPTMPVVAAQALDLLRHPDVGAREIAQLLEKDPVIAARALRLATSAAFAGSRKLSLQEAVARLGTKAVRALLVEASTRRIFTSRNPVINEQLTQLWEHSVAVGLIARDVLAVTGGADSEAAYLAGLLHDVGKPIVATMLLEVERNLSEVHQRNWIDSGEWLEVVTRVHRPVGVALAEKWQLPGVISACIRDVAEYDQLNRANLANPVCFGNALAKKAGLAGGPVDEDDVDALVMIGRSLLGVSDDVIRTLTKGLGERVANLYA